MRDKRNKNKSKIDKLYASQGDLKGEIDLVWNPVTNASSYVIQISKVNGKENWKQVDIVSKSHCTITGLRSNHQYKFRAASITGSKEYEWSETAEERAS